MVNATHLIPLSHVQQEFLNVQHPGQESKASSAFFSSLHSSYKLHQEPLQFFLYHIKVRQKQKIKRKSGGEKAGEWWGGMQGGKKSSMYQISHPTGFVYRQLCSITHLTRLKVQTYQQIDNLHPGLQRLSNRAWMPSLPSFPVPCELRRRQDRVLGA